MTVVVLALGAGLHLQLGLTGQTALVAAGVSWVALLALHLWVSRPRTAAVAEAPVRGNANADPGSPASQDTAAALKRRARIASRPEPATRSKPPPLPERSPSLSHGPALGAGPVRRPPDDEPPGLSPAMHTPVPQPPPGRDAGPRLPAAMGWDLRPGGQRDAAATAIKPAVFPPLHRPPEQQARAAVGQDSRRAVPAAPTMSQAGEHGLRLDGQAVAGEERTDPEVAEAKATEARAMQSIIDQLARQLTAPSEREAAAGGIGLPPAHSDEALTQSIDALRNAGDAMRVAAAGMPRGRRPERPPVIQPPEQSLSQHTELVAGGRPEVYLDSILALEDRKARHFEISLRIRTATGELVAGDDRGLMLAGNGVRAQVDAAKLLRVARIAERLSTRGASACLFVNLATDSLVDDSFLDVCASIVTAQPSIAGQLVLSFAQDEVRSFAKPHWDTLATLRENGLRFAAEGLGDLAMDFAILKERRFEFVKIEAPVLLAGMQAHDGIVPPLGIWRRLADAGLGLVVNRIDDEASLTQVAALGVSLGQGTVFGTPRPVKVELKGPQVAAA